MSNESFEVGDVVWLNSGGPAMTVTDTEVDPNRKIECQWFTPDGPHPSEGKFPRGALTKQKPAATPLAVR